MAPNSAPKEHPHDSDGICRLRRDDSGFGKFCKAWYLFFIHLISCILFMAAVLRLIDGKTFSSDHQPNWPTQVDIVPSRRNWDCVDNTGRDSGLGRCRFHPPHLAPDLHPPFQRRNYPCRTMPYRGQESLAAAPLQLCKGVRLVYLPHYCSGSVYGRRLSLFH
jgi:hypothetical protein